jgi:hypothetical protein
LEAKESASALTGWGAFFMSGRYRSAMPRKTAPKPSDDIPATVALARELSAAASAIPGRDVEAPHERPGGLFGSNAAFVVRDAEGRTFSVIIARTH